MEMGMKPLVSVIIPVYNEEQYIKTNLLSVINQTYSNMEIIIVDDGSTDKSLEIIKGYQFRNPQISLIAQDNLYAGVARNNGLKNAKGDFVMFLDSDDFFSPYMIETMVNKAVETNSDIVFCSGYGFDNVTKEVYKLPCVGKKNIKFPNKEVFNANDIKNGIFQMNVTWAWDKLYRKSFLLENKLTFQDTKVCNDLCFVCLSYLFSNNITFVDDYYVCHRTNIATSLYNNGEKNWKDLFASLSLLKDKMVKANLFDEYIQSYINLAAENIVYYLIMRILDSTIFNDFYDYYFNNIVKEFNFLAYPKSYYKDAFVYDVLFNLENSKKEIFLISITDMFNSKNNHIIPKTVEQIIVEYCELNKVNTVLICDKKEGKGKIDNSIYLSTREINIYYLDVEKDNSIISSSYEQIDFSSVDLTVIVSDDFESFCRIKNNIISNVSVSMNIKWVKALETDDWMIEYIE